MKKWALPFLAVVCFVSESIFVDVWPKNHVYIDYFFVPRFFLIFIVFAAIYIGQTRAMVYGLIFGVLYDCTYTELLGVYSFSFPFIAYIAAKAMKVLHQHWLIACFLSLFSIAVLELYVYGIQLLIGRTNMPFQMFCLQRLSPTLLLNVVFLVLLSYPLKQQLVKIKRLEQED
ncbi:rod shape-determining protein MreD [Parageobacillus thermoglucosidasius]|uniref:rod shape-determining protein MreD n=1 Tax=Parageobacillus thermoglucosidasius TaxID=1426 RepID=UPI000E19547D|nr:rod shape-determining protein MreD [Parageobacillus thermoglucosidasius]RDE20197.1 rod shape-determining protein MreD [Parageobacillus thermoglucosidasius]GCD81680.1 rod shape-determining protein MreD [Parageobacillus thermoglucosidasius]